MVNETRRQNDEALLSVLRSLEDERKQDREILTCLQKSIETFMMGVDSENHRKAHEYIDLVIQREKEKAAMRRAIIEKTLSSLIWAAIVGLAVAVGHYLFPKIW